MGMGMEPQGGFESAPSRASNISTYFGGYLNDLRAVAAGLCIAFRPRQCTEANSSVVVCVLVVLALTCHRRLGLCLPEPEMLCNISLMAMEQAAEQQLEDGNRNKAMRKLMASICNR